MSAQGDKFRNRPGEDASARRTAEDELMRGDRGVGPTGSGTTGGSGTAGGGMENEGTGSLLVDEHDAAGQEARDAEAPAGNDKPSDRSRGGQQGSHPTEQDRAADGNETAGAGNNAREGYEDHGSSRDDEGTSGESSGSRPGYR